MAAGMNGYEFEEELYYFLWGQLLKVYPLIFFFNVSKINNFTNLVDGIYLYLNAM